MIASGRAALASGGEISGSGLAMAKMIGSLAIVLDHLGLERARRRQAEEHVGADQRFRQRARVGLDRMRRLPLVEAVAALVDHALAVAHDDMVVRARPSP